MPKNPTKPQKTDEERAAPWAEWLDAVTEDVRQDGTTRPQITHVTDEALRCLSDFYEARGGRLTATRLGYIGKAFLKMEPDVGLIAAEVFCDGHGGTKDEKYLVGIARRMNRLSAEEFTSDLMRHRERQNGRGVWSGRPR